MDERRISAIDHAGRYTPRRDSRLHRIEPCALRPNRGHPHADHGGTGTSHGDAAVLTNYRVPFYAWGPGIPAGRVCYLMNPASRLDPGISRPTICRRRSPSGTARRANVALDLLGIGAVPGSTARPAQDLFVSCADGSCALRAWR